MRMRGLLILLSLALATPSTLVQAQNTEPADPAGNINMIYFDEQVAFPTFHRLAAYRSWGDKNIFFLLPTDIEESPVSGISLLYDTSGGELRGNLTLTLEPSFDATEFQSIVSELNAQVPGGMFSIAEPVNSEWELQGFGLKQSLSPVLMSNPLLSGTSVTVEIPPLFTRTLLHSGSHYASAFVIRHKFSVRGIELDDNMQPRIVTRWFSRGVSFPGGCGVAPERYVNLDTGLTGCAFRIQNSHDDIVEVQHLLNQLNLYTFRVDGIAGPRTRAAVRAFQKQSGMLQDGQITSALVTNLVKEATTGNN